MMVDESVKLFLAGLLINKGCTNRNHD